MRYAIVICGNTCDINIILHTYIYTYVSNAESKMVWCWLDCDVHTIAGGLRARSISTALSPLIVDHIYEFLNFIRYFVGFHAQHFSKQNLKTQQNNQNLQISFWYLFNFGCFCMRVATVCFQNFEFPIMFCAFFFDFRVVTNLSLSNLFGLIWTY